MRTGKGAGATCGSSAVDETGNQAEGRTIEQHGGRKTARKFRAAPMIMFAAEEDSGKKFRLRMQASQQERCLYPAVFNIKK